MYDFILALDPSGSYYEGKGTTGWSVYNALSSCITKAGNLKAVSYKEMEYYWDAHLSLIEKYHARYKERMIVVIEDYMLYSGRATSQINSRMETCKLIGVIQHFCAMNDIPYKMQLAAEVKSRWSNEILEYKHILLRKDKGYVLTDRKTKVDKHAIDSVRHAIHYATFKNGKKGKQ